MSDRSNRIKDKLVEAFTPTHFELIDDSQSHAGHAGVQETGGGHFFVTMVSEQFEGKSRVKRHQLIYAALGTMMQSDIHALSIKSFTPQEFSND
jgi:BolA protein